MASQSEPGTQQKRFSIALSYPGEKRPYVEQVASQLRAKLGNRLFYDKDYEAELARPNLDTYLQGIYHDDSELIAVFLCADYERKDWCGLEWRVVRDLIKRRQASAIMPLRFDETEIPGLFSTDGYVWLPERTPQQVADLIMQRIQIKLQQDVAQAQSKLENLSLRTQGQSDSAKQPLSGSKVEELFASTLCSRLSIPIRMQAARSLASSLRERTQLDGEALYRTGRFLVEHRLLTAVNVPHCELTPEGRVLFAEGEEELWAAVEDLAESASDTPRITIEPESFLERAQGRAQDWYKYFSAAKQGLEPPSSSEDLQTLCLIDVEGRGAAIAPQYLVAGLMSYFHEEWSPVIRGYTDVGAKAGTLDRLKASQWICWLVWGPSIPLCGCSRWQPASAQQFGYGDEDNSLPVYFVRDPEPVLKSLRASQGDRRAIHVMNVVGRLAWAPFTFRANASFAPAQARLTTSRPSSSKGANGQEANGLLFKLEQAQPRNAHPKEPAYFTSYIWLMFWVTRAGQGKSLRRLDGEQLPSPTNAADNRQLMSSEMLWQDLLPVFAHANIFDAVVLALQKGMLIENALHLLRRAWASESQNIEFHLVCASDYSGCGTEIQFPAPKGESLIELLRSRLGEVRKNDPEFANCICVPEEGSKPADEFQLFFSACHLPEMVEAYYQFLKDKQT